MANTIDWGQGAVNNTNGWGKSATNNTIDFGEVCADSWSPETNLTGSSSAFTNTYSTDYDGIDAYISTDSTYSEVDGDSQMTLSLWTKLDNVASFRIFASATRDATLNNFVFMLCHINAQLRFFTSSTGQYTYSNSVLTAGAWTHIAVFVDKTQGTSGTRCKIFINGQDETAANSQNTSVLETSNAPLYIGENQNGKYSPMLGNIDELAIWSGTDLRNDVSTLYNSGVPNNLNDNGLTAPTSWYRFEEGSGTTIADSGSSTNNATIQNSVTFEADVPS
jgi:hypothetical protein